MTDVDDFIKGLSTWQYADRVNDGDFRYGDAWAVSRYITPVFNTLKGTMSNQTLGIFSGGEHLDSISSIGLINGELYVNRPTSIFDGISYQTVHTSTSGCLAQHTDPIPPDTSNGVQFVP